MGTTVGNKDIATTGSGHTTLTPPATSLNPPTPPAGPVPVPYPYTARSATAKQTKKQLKAGGSPVLVKGSVMNVDPPANQPSQPTGGDVVTHAVKGKATMTQGSSNTKAGGKPVCATGDMNRCNVITAQQSVAQQTMPLLKAGGADAAGGKGGGGAEGDKVGKRALPAQAAKKCTQAGHPVDVARGVVLDSAVDFQLPGTIALDFERNYSSARANETTSLGRGGWVHSFEQWVLEGEEHWTLRDADGRDVQFAKVGPGESAFHRGERLTLKIVSEGRFEVYEHASRLTRHYLRNEGSVRCRLGEIRDSHGNVVRLEYDGDRLVRIVDTAARELRLQHGPLGYVTRVEVWASEPLPAAEPDAPPVQPQPLALEQWADFTYHETGELAAAADAHGQADRFEYDALHCMVKTTLKNGVSFHYAYDEDTGFCIKTWGDGGLHEIDLHPDFESNTTLVSGTNAPRLYTWNDEGLVIEERTADGSLVRAFEYDDDQYLLSETNAAGETSRQEFDDRGNLIATRDAAGNETRWVYEEDLPEKRISPEGLETRFQHDQHCELTNIRYPSGLAYGLAYDEHGRLSEVHGPRGLLRQFRHDSHHNLAEERDARGGRTVYLSERLGRPRLRIDTVGRKTAVTYDRLRQPVEVVSPSGSRSQLEYEPLGNVCRVTDALGQVTKMAYAGTGVLGQLTGPDGRRWRFGYDSDERLRRIENPRRDRYEFRYDAAGRVDEERTFDGRILGYRYDNAERLRRIEYPDETWREFSYDPLGNLLSDTSPHGAIHLERDPSGRLQRSIAEDAWGDVENAFEWDDIGRLVTERQGVRSIQYQYDAEGRRSERILPGGETTRYEYDDLGDLTAIDHDGTRVDIRRDAMGRESRRYVAASGVSLESSYDEMDRLAGQRVSVPSPEGQDAIEVLKERKYRYDALGRPSHIEDSAFGATEYGYDRIGQLISATTARGHEIFEYDPAGSLVNALGRLEHVGGTSAWDVGPGNVLERSDRAGFENDRRGRRTAKVEAVAAAEGGRTEERTEYEWDCRDYLREVRLPDGRTVRFRYDAFGRRVEKQVFPAEHGDYGGLAQLVLSEGAAAVPQPVVTEFVWDGDVLAADIGAVAEAVSPVAATGAETPSGNSRPVGERAPGAETDGVAAWRAAHRVVRVFVHEAGTGVPVLQAEGGHVCTCVTDHVGLPRELVDDRGRIAWSATHSAWGKVEEVRRDPSARPVESPFRLLGQYHDDETGLCYTRFRYFDPEHGRWCSPDPLGVFGGANLLGFDGTPTHEVDELGLICKAGAKRIVDREIERILGEMSEGDKRFTTFAVAVVRLPNGKHEVWVSAAGAEGRIPPKIQGGNYGITRPGRARDQHLPNINDAERAILRQSRSEGAEIVAIGATRPVCPHCQDALGRSGYGSAIVTERK